MCSVSWVERHTRLKLKETNMILIQVATYFPLSLSDLLVHIRLKHWKQIASIYLIFKKFSFKNDFAWWNVPFRAWVKVILPWQSVVAHRKKEPVRRGKEMLNFLNLNESSQPISSTAASREIFPIGLNCGRRVDGTSYWFKLRATSRRDQSHRVNCFKI